MDFSYAVNQAQSQSQSQKLILTAEMRESLELLQMPLSDQSITQSLQKHGIAISRRTVAKYRDEMLIPIAGKRKAYN